MFLNSLFSLLFAGSAWASGPQFRNVILIGWDGAYRSTVQEMLAKGSLPNLKSLIDRGAWTDLSVKEGAFGGKVGWSQLLTGYNSGMMREFTDFFYGPMPKGFTLFERLKEKFGLSGIQTTVVAQFAQVLSAQGPHEICNNCLLRLPENGTLVPYWDFDRAVAPPGIEKNRGKIAGGILRDAAPAIDVLEIGTGKQTLEKALVVLERSKDKRFFVVLDFSAIEALAKGGVHSPEYARSLADLDAALGSIERKLEALKESERTAVLVTTDLGLDQGELAKNPDTPASFLATNFKGPRTQGDRRDVAPTIYNLFGISTDALRPPLLGRSLLARAEEKTAAQNLPTMRIGYFVGGRTSLLYRALLTDAFRKEGIDVQLLVRGLRHGEYVPLEKQFGKYSGFLGKASGNQLVDGTVSGEFDGATIGEVSFIEAALAGKPIVAVAELGHDTMESPGHAIALRRGLKIRSANDFKGLTLAARRSSGGDLVMLREFLIQKGLDPDRDVKILSNVYEDDYKQGIIEGKIDGGYFHLGTLRRQAGLKYIYIYQPLNWVNPEISHALLVFSRDYLARHPDRVEEMVRAYMHRISYEKSLSREERRRIQTVTLVMETDFNGLNFPQYEKIPRVRPALIDQMQDLLLRHHAISRKAEILSRIDNRFVERISDELYPDAAPAVQSTALGKHR